jgi:hypothetical protein
MKTLNENLWIARINTKLHHDFLFINEALDLSAFVESNCINLVEAGVNPAVLKTNTTYPVPAGTTHERFPLLTLPYFHTESTIVQNVELAEHNDEKMESIIYDHRTQLILNQLNQSLHAYAPTTHSNATPIIPSTGKPTGGYRSISYDDIASLATRFDHENIPRTGRILVIDSRAQEQLRIEDRNLFHQMMQEAGYIYGFKVSAYDNMPIYNENGKKTPYSHELEPSDRYAYAVAFQKEEVMKAIGTTSMYYRLQDKDARGDIIGFYQRFLSLPVRNRGIGAIIPGLLT